MNFQVWSPYRPGALLMTGNDVDGETAHGGNTAFFLCANPAIRALQNAMQAFGMALGITGISMLIVPISTAMHRTTAETHHSRADQPQDNSRLVRSRQSVRDVTIGP